MADAFDPSNAAPVLWFIEYLILVLWASYDIWSGGRSRRRSAFHCKGSEIRVRSPYTMSLNVGQGIKDRMTANQDHPIVDSTFITNSNGSKVEKCLGLK